MLHIGHRSTACTKLWPVPRLETSWFGILSSRILCAGTGSGNETAARSGRSQARILPMNMWNRDSALVVDRAAAGDGKPWPDPSSSAAGRRGLLLADLPVFDGGPVEPTMSAMLHIRYTPRSPYEQWISTLSGPVGPSQAGFRARNCTESRGESVASGDVEETRVWAPQSRP